VSPFLVDVTVQVPTLVYVRVVPETEHPAVPADARAKVYDPPPDPPVAVSVANGAGFVTD
jgi:hypothetical protein